MAKRPPRRAVGKDGTEAHEDFLIEVEFIRVWRHLDCCDGQAGEAGRLIEDSRVESFPCQLFHGEASTASGPAEDERADRKSDPRRAHPWSTGSIVRV